MAVIIAGVLFYPMYLFFSGISFRYSIESKAALSIEFLMKSEKTRELELYYNITTGIAADKKKIVTIFGRDQQQQVNFKIPEELSLKGLRFGIGPGKDTVVIHEMNFYYGSRSFVWNADSIAFYFRPHDMWMKNEAGRILLSATGNDPFIGTAHDFSGHYNKLINRNKNPFIAFIFAFTFSIFFFFIVLQGGKELREETVNTFPASKTIIINKAKYKYNLALTCTYLCILCMPVIFMRFKILKDHKVVEKRYQAEKPPLKLESLADYPEGFSAYFNDNFGLRSELIRVGNYIKTKVSYSALANEKVIIGKDGWLFFGAENTADYYRNANPFSEEQLFQIKQILEERSDWCEMNGIKYYFVFPPMSATIYPEYLPESVRKINPQSRLEQVLSFLKDHHCRVKIVDVRPELLEEKRSRSCIIKQIFTGIFPEHLQLTKSCCVQ